MLKIFRSGSPLLCRQVPQLFRSHRFHPGPQMPINSIPKRYYGYYEERKILEQELLKDLDKLQDGDEEEFAERQRDAWSAFNTLPHEKKIQFIREFRTKISEMAVRKFDFENPPPNPGGFTPSTTPEAKAEYIKSMNELSPEDEGSGPPEPQDWSGLSLEDGIRAVRDIKWRKEMGLPEEDLDDLLEKIDRAERLKDTPEGEELNYELMQRLRDFPDPEDNFKIQEDTTKIERDGGVDNKTKEATERQKQKTESKQMNDLEPSQNDSNTSQSSTEIHLQEEATKIFEEGGPALREKLDQLLEQIGVTGDQEIDLESMEKKMKESGLDMRDVAASLGLKI